MTLCEIIELKYAQALAEITRIQEAGPQTAQARYDYKKAVRQGRIPKPQAQKLERIKHEMEHERRWVLRGVQEVLDFLKPQLTEKQFEQLCKEVGDVQSAIER